MKNSLIYFLVLVFLVAATAGSQDITREVLIFLGKTYVIGGWVVSWRQKILSFNYIVYLSALMLVSIFLLERVLSLEGILYLVFLLLLCETLMCVYLTSNRLQVTYFLVSIVVVMAVHPFYSLSFMETFLVLVFYRTFVWFESSLKYFSQESKEVKSFFLVLAVIILSSNYYAVGLHMVGYDVYLLRNFGAIFFVYVLTSGHLMYYTNQISEKYFRVSLLSGSKDCIKNG
jgi:hypothetical protein